MRGSVLSLSFVEPNKRDRLTNQIDQLPATRRDDFGRRSHSSRTYAEVIMLAEHRLTAVSGGRNIKA